MREEKRNNGKEENSDRVYIHKQLYKLHSRELKPNETHYNEQVNNANKNLYNARSI